MRIDEKQRNRGIAAVFTMVLLGIGTAAWAQERTYEGDIVALDGKANTFTVRGTKPGEVMEMAFHAGPKSEMVVDGERVVFGELVKGDHVMVSYEPEGTIHTVRRVERRRSASQEMTFAGNVIGVDVKAQTFTVKKRPPAADRECNFT